MVFAIFSKNFKNKLFLCVHSQIFYSLLQRNDLEVQQYRVVYNFTQDIDTFEHMKISFLTMKRTIFRTESRSQEIRF